MSGLGGGAAGHPEGVDRQAMPGERERPREVLAADVAEQKEPVLIRQLQEMGPPPLDEPTISLNGSKTNLGFVHFLVFCFILSRVTWLVLFA